MTDLILLRDWQASQIEFWKRVEGWPYEVSNFGRVRTWRTTTHRPGGGYISVESEAPIILKPGIKLGRYSGRYAQMNVRRAGEVKAFLIHRLVAQAFIPNPEGLPQVNHRNGIKHDNRVENLEWVSSKENHAHALASGLRRVGGQVDSAKLSDSRVWGIRIRAASGESQRSLSRAYGVSRTTIKGVVAGRLWKHVDSQIRL